MERITVKKARINAKMKQQEVARKLNLCVSSYARKENGKSKFYVDEIMVLSELWGIQVEHFSESMQQVV